MSEQAKLRIHNTLTRRKEAFEPLNPARVTMYACGPTVYNNAHIGNARPAVIFDLLHRLLQQHYPEVVYARNITDVDDKINQSAADQGVSIDVISKRYTDAYHEDMAALGVRKPSIEPRATDHIPGMIQMIERLIASDHAYVAEGHVLFSIESYADYGHLSRRDMKEMVAGARVEVAPYKRHPGDFVLWKPSSETQPGWDSPWGRGRPGWHLECSVMSEQHLGETIDIHAGGQDLVFPHHENEIAQSTCANAGTVFARYWMHNGFVTVEGRKMSKSLGNVIIVHDLLEEHPGEALRYLLLSAHYRQPLDWSEAALHKSQRTLDRLYGVLRDARARWGDLPAADAPPDALLEALGDDLNTPEALAVLNQISRSLANADDPQTAAVRAADLLAAGFLLGLLQQEPDVWFQGDQDDESAIQALIDAREAARESRDFARADQIRDELSSRGIELEDGADGTRWRRRGPG